MKKFISYAIPMLTLTAFILLMLGGNYLKRPLSPSENVVAYAELSIEHAKAQKWDMLEKDVVNIDFAWKKIMPRIQFSVERDELYNINLNIARLKGSITSEDKTSTIIELNELLENWAELTR